MVQEFFISKNKNLKNSEKKEIVYKGHWKDDQPHGNGIYFFRNGIIYRGEYFEGEQQGEGEILSPNGSIYRGSWIQGKKEGKGLFFNSKEGKVIYGEWEGDILDTLTKIVVVNKEGDKEEEMEIEEGKRKEEAQKLIHQGFFSSFNEEGGNSNSNHCEGHNHCEEHNHSEDHHHCEEHHHSEDHHHSEEHHHNCEEHHI